LVARWLLDAGDFRHVCRQPFLPTFLNPV
jgi:hypothetical protein